VSGSPSIVRRIVNEHRRTLVLLAILFGVNVAVYAAVVYPLSSRVANIQQRDAAAEAALQAARVEHAQANGTLTGKDRARAELDTFYRDVLPTTWSGARQLTHLRLPQLARQAGLRWEGTQMEPAEQQGSALSQLRSRMVLSGSYADVRTFLHELETAPEFVVIENVSLAEEDADTGSLVVTLLFSTYYREAAR